MSLTLGIYFTVYISSRPNTDTLLLTELGQCLKRWLDGQMGSVVPGQVCTIISRGQGIGPRLTYCPTIAQSIVQL